MSTMRKFAIITDSSGDLVVIPSKWLNENKSHYYWPDHLLDATDLIINNEDMRTTWKVLPLEKYIRSSDSYTAAVAELKMFENNISDMTDFSDDNKLKRTRAKRHKKTVDSDDEIAKKKSKNSSPKPLKNDGTISDSEDSVSSHSSKENDPEPRHNFTNNGPCILNNDSPASAGCNNKVGSLPNVSGANSLPNDELGNTHHKKDGEVSKDKISEYSLTDRQLLLLLAGNQKNILEKLNALKATVNNVGGNNCKQCSCNNATIPLAQNQLKILSKYFPINEVDKLLIIVEEKLKNQNFYSLIQIDKQRTVIMQIMEYNYLKSIGGNSPKAHLDEMIKFLITDDVLVGYSYTGQSKKNKTKNQSFQKLNLHNLVFYCIKDTYANNNLSTVDIKKYISSYLDSASTRIAREKTKLNDKTTAIMKPLHLDISTTFNLDEDDDL